MIEFASFIIVLVFTFPFFLVGIIPYLIINLFIKSNNYYGEAGPAVLYCWSSITGFVISAIALVSFLALKG